MRVGIRDLKEHLSEYVGLAARGETIEITHRGRAVARLVPLPMAARVEQAVQEGWLTLGDGSAPAAERPVFRSAASLRDVLEADRGE
jgi:prevent-host-death family protein